MWNAGRHTDTPHRADLPAQAHVTACLLTRCWAAALVAALGACGGDSTVADGTLGPHTAAALVAVSGDQQPAKAGRDLPEPLVVRVTDDRGGGVSDVTVTWTVESGEGSFNGRFESVGCPPLGTAQVRTDADGFARITFMPTWFGPSTVAASVLGADGSPAMFTADASDPEAIVLVVDGDEQRGKTGEALPNRMWVKVMNGEGDAVPNVSVTWTVRSRVGELAEGCPWTQSWNRRITTVRTLAAGQLVGAEGGEGLAWARFLPHELATDTVSAAVPGVMSAAALFVARTTTAVVALIHDGWLNTFYFRGPGSTPVVTVPLGTTVEFRNDASAARIASTSVPTGGAPFDSGEMDQGERFAFVPQVVGTWEFVDEISGATGRLEVH